MALIYCRECGKQISDQAEMCPHCGYQTIVKKVETVAERKRKEREQEREKKEARRKEIEARYQKELFYLNIGSIGMTIIEGILLVVVFVKMAGVEDWDRKLKLYMEYDRYQSEIAPILVLWFCIVVLGIFDITINIMKKKMDKEMRQELYHSDIVVEESLNVWCCPLCGKENAHYVGTCSCGGRKPD